MHRSKQSQMFTLSHRRQVQDEGLSSTKTTPCMLLSFNLKHPKPAFILQLYPIFIIINRHLFPVPLLPCFLNLAPDAVLAPPSNLEKAVKMKPVLYYNINFQFNPSIEIGMEHQSGFHHRSKDWGCVAAEGVETWPGPRQLHEEVIRKNNEIIRNFLSKLNEVFARQEQYDAALKAINEKLGKLSQMTENLQFEFRATYLETARQQSQLTSDMALVRGALHIPALGTPHEAYLSSDFFRERANNVNSRMREGRGALRHRTNHDLIHTPTNPANDSATPAHKQSIFSKNQNSLTRHTKNRSELPSSQADEDLSKPTESCIRNSVDYPLSSLEASNTLAPKIEELSQKMENCVSQSQLSASLVALRQELEERVGVLLGERKSECEWNHIDFDELQNYIDSKIEEQLTDKVGKKYFQASLNNLKEAWEQEEAKIYQAIAAKADEIEVNALRQKMAQVCLKGDQQPSHSSLKTSTICLNNVLTPHTLNKRHHHRISAREMVHPCDSPDTTILFRKDDQKRKSKAALPYTNSLSTLSRSTDKRETRTANYDDLSSSHGAMRERVWREKASEALGEDKIKKKTKIIA